MPSSKQLSTLNYFTSLSINLIKNSRYMNIDEYFIKISWVCMHFPVSAINANLNCVTKNQTPTLTLLFNLRSRLICLICGIVHLLVPFKA